MPATAAVSANEGALIAFNKADQKGLIILENSGRNRNRNGYNRKR